VIFMRKLSARRVTVSETALGPEARGREWSSPYGVVLKTLLADGGFV